ncbi:MAG TPA: hypothetical protein P5330_02405, partial [Candidatus Competibacteraceae bacterium]|nr:hypothetical protein [Candidatus Competibacteraceae bacterium]
MPTFFQRWTSRIAAVLGGPAQNPPEPLPIIRKTGDAKHHGSGASAQDSGTAAGAGGAAIGGNVYGNVQITNAAHVNQTSETALRAAYLHRIREQCGYLSLAGIDPAAANRRDTESRLSLDAVYTALLTHTPREREAEQDARASQDRPERDVPPLSALEQLDRYPKLVLQGDPGSGKSTFVNMVAVCLAGESLGDHHRNLRYLTAPLPDREGAESETPQPWRHGALLPVPVVLRDFAATGLPQDDSASAQHLWAFIKAQLESAALAEYVTPLCNALREYGGLLLLDGLDEVPE